MEKSGKHLFCFGYGYSCAFLGQSLADDGWDLSGTTRDKAKKEQLKSAGIQSYIFDRDVPLADPLYYLRDVTHILISTPPCDEGDPTFNIHADDLVRLPKLEWIGYLSTTGPYGDRDGEWVDETTPPRPTTQRGTRRLKAEDQWLGLLKSHNLPVHIFRLAGIYGPERSAIESVRSGIARRINKPGQAFSRIHVHDIVQVLRASIAAPAPGQIYNLCDDFPAPSHEVIAFACSLIGVEPPPLLNYKDADLAPITMSFYKDNKRVRNDKIKNDLGVTLYYKSYKEGLQQCLEAAENGFPEDFVA